MPLAPATRLSAYKILAQLRAGDMGELYRATDPPMEHYVALKVLPAVFSSEVGQGHTLFHSPDGDHHAHRDRYCRHQYRYPKDACLAGPCA